MVGRELKVGKFDHMRGNCAIDVESGHSSTRIDQAYRAATRNAMLC